eukprot:1160811-Pelagomonas_calceolata.AAC.1
MMGQLISWLDAVASSRSMVTRESGRMEAAFQDSRVRYQDGGYLGLGLRPEPSWPAGGHWEFPGFQARVGWLIASIAGCSPWDLRPECLVPYTICILCMRVARKDLPGGMDASFNSIIANAIDCSGIRDLNSSDLMPRPSGDNYDLLYQPRLAAQGFIEATLMQMSALCWMPWLKAVVKLLRFAVPIKVGCPF